MKRGVTLVEILITVGIIGLLTLAVSTFQRNVFYFGNFFQDTLQASGDAQRILKPMMGEIRSAARSSLGGYHIKEAGEAQLILYADIDENNYTEQIRYFVEDEVVKRGVITPSGSPLTYDPANEEIKELIKNATLELSYYDGEGNLLAFPVSLPNVRLVEVTISVEADPNRSPEPVTVTSQATIRNLKDNL